MISTKSTEHRQAVEAEAAYGRGVEPECWQAPPWDEYEAFAAAETARMNAAIFDRHDRSGAA